MTLESISAHLPYAVALWVLAWGLYGIVTSKHLVHLILSLGVVQTSTYVLLTLIGFRSGGVAPILLDVPDTVKTVDPVVQALMLTDVVVEATVMALLLAMAVKVHSRAGVLDPAELARLRG